MTAKEVHIQFDLVYQSINSHVRRTLEPQEIDWLFNESALSYIKERTNPKNNPKKDGFEETSKRYEDVEQLISTVSTPLYIADSVYPDSMMGFKPANFLDYIPESGFKVKVFYGCDFDFVSYTANGNSSIWTSVIDFPVDENAAPNYQDFTIVVDAVTIFDSTSFPPLNASLTTTELKFYLLNLIIETINNGSPVTGIYAYWQKFKGIGSTVNNINNALILVSYTGKTSATISFTGTAPTVNGFSQNNTLVRYTDANLTGLTGVVTPCRLIKSTDRENLLEHSFGSTKPTSPIVSVENDLILVHHKKRFIVNGLFLTYIRKPRKIDLSLSINPELSDDICLEIIDIAARKVAGRNNSDNLQGIVNESLLKQ